MGNDDASLMMSLAGITLPALQARVDESAARMDRPDVQLEQLEEYVAAARAWLAYMRSAEALVGDAGVVDPADSVAGRLDEFEAVLARREVAIADLKRRLEATS
jgi:hypothetical protein